MATPRSAFDPDEVDRKLGQAAVEEKGAPLVQVSSVDQESSPSSYTRTDTETSYEKGPGHTQTETFYEKGRGHTQTETFYEKGAGEGRPNEFESIVHQHDAEFAAAGTPRPSVDTAGDLVTQVLAVEDDPSLNPWTFRFWFLGTGLSLFGSTLATIYYFKPQTVYVSVIFLTIISFILGEAMARLIPRKGWVGRWFNPHSFNHKEHAAIVIMASTSSTCALGTEVLAVQRLYYTTSPNALVSIFLLFSSQLLGYGIAGLFRGTLVYPTKMLYPINLPLNTLLDTLHKDKAESSKRLKLFYYVFVALFVWEIFPEYVMPLLTGISVMCLANQHSMLFTNLFGGSNGNEGLGFLSVSLDWQYIAGTVSPLWFPLQTLVNNLVGYLLCICVFMGVYYMNIWRAQDFPFLSQLLFSAESNGTSYVQYNQTAILGANNEVDPAALAVQGLPFFSSSYTLSLLTTNLAIAATFVHLLLWNYGDISSAWGFVNMASIKRALHPKKWNFRFWQAEDGTPRSAQELAALDPHYRLMLAYNEVPTWWYAGILVVSVAVGLICIYEANSTLPWFGFIVACALSAICILFFGAQYAITGFSFIIQPIIQMIGGYLHPGRPMANMYFTLFGYNSVQQGMLLLKDLKLAQYAKLSPKCTFTAQFAGTMIGAIFNYIMMSSIVKNQRDILLSVEGSNVWSGQNVQQYNSQAIAWGGLAREMFSVGGRYEWVTLSFLVGLAIPLPFYFLHRLFPRAGFSYWNTAIITYYIGFLCVGINSSIMGFFLVGFASQFWLRKYHADWFIKYNYILSAAMDGGTQVIVFILTFAVQGGSGVSRKFPIWWGNNASGNFDRCMHNPADS